LVVVVKMAAKWLSSSRPYVSKHVASTCMARER
jgi:hypothetical protein